MGAEREGGDDVEWVGKALRAVGAEGVWAHIGVRMRAVSVGEALKAVWVVGSVGGGWRCSQLLKPVNFLTGRHAKTNPSGFLWRRPSRGRRILRTKGRRR